MYRKEKKIPTLLALCLLFLGIGTTIYLDRQQQTLFSQASGTVLPEEVHFTNISDTSFTVSWLTNTPTIGIVIVSANNTKQTLLDNLDSDNVGRPRTAHYVTVKNLKEDNSYTAQILNGNKKCNNTAACPSFTQKTATKLTSALSLPPARGIMMKTAGKIADGAIVYLVVNKSAPLSARVDSSGLWVVPFNNLRTTDLLTRPQIADNDIVQITAQLSPTEETFATVDLKSIRQNLTIPDMTMGNSYNFIDLISKKDLLAKSAGPKILGIKIKATPSPKMEIMFPKNDNDTTIDKRPRFRGTGVPDSQFTITVNSSPQTGKIIVAKDGTWDWRPARELPAGIHYLSLQGYDGKGNLITLNRKFVVLKSGEAVLGDATPSASLTLTPTSEVTPTITPTPNPSLPTPSPSPTSIISPTATTIPTIPPTTVPPVIPPRSGDTSTTLILLGSSASLLLLGMKFLISL